LIASLTREITHGLGCIAGRLLVTHSDVLDPRLLCGHSYLQRKIQKTNHAKTTLNQRLFLISAFYFAAWLTSTTGMPTMPKMYLTPSFTEKGNIFEGHLAIYTVS
jgi:hypothetical protein